MDVDLSILNDLFLKKDDIDIVPLDITYTDDSTETINVIVQKDDSVTSTINIVWDDNNNQQSLRPGGVIASLSQDGVNIFSVTITENMGWTYTIDNLEKYRDVNEEFSYVWSLRTVSGYTLQNTETVGTTTTFTLAFRSPVPLPE